MATIGSNSSVSATDAGPQLATVVIGLAGLDRVDSEAVLEGVRASLAECGVAAAWTIVVARPGAGADDKGATPDAARGIVEVGYALQPSDALTEPYHGQPGRARAVRAILAAARERQAAACVLLDGRAAGAEASWIGGFARALVGHGLDFVTPVHRRHPFTGALVGGIVGPMYRALYGVRLQQPIGMPVGCSSRFIDAVLSDPVWDSDVGQVASDLWMSTMAAAGGFQVGEATVPAAAPDERPRIHLSTTIAQIVGFLFTDMEPRARVWQRVRGSKEVPRCGAAPPAPPERPDVDVALFVDTFRQAYRDLQDVWAEVLPPLEVLQWRRLASASPDAFRVTDTLWARTLYDFAMGHRLRVIAREHLLGSLTPMYLGWLASFMMEMRMAPVEAIEARLERLCRAFEAEKPYLVSRWRWPARFKPVKMRR